MRFIFEYRTSDNVRHRGTINASSREMAYATLKAKGIRPSWLEEAPGVLNKLLGKGKRWIAIVVLTAIATFSIVTVRGLKSDVEQLSFAPRSQIYGDPSIIQKCEQKRWTNVFVDEGELFLARFAQPGKLSGMPSDGEDLTAFVEALRKTYGKKVVIDSTDTPEVAKMKRIVNGMKAELVSYISAGGTVPIYVERLIERQRVEATILKNAVDDFERYERMAEKSQDRRQIIEKWNQKNDTLRGLGLPSTPLPDSWDEDEETFRESEKVAPEGLTDQYSL